MSKRTITPLTEREIFDKLEDIELKLNRLGGRIEALSVFLFLAIALALFIASWFFYTIYPHTFLVESFRVILPVATIGYLLVVVYKSILWWKLR